MLSLKVSSPRIVFFDTLKFGARFLKIALIVVAMVGVGAGLNLGWQKLFVENAEFTISEISLKTFDGKEPRFLTHARFLEKTELETDATIFSLDTEELAAILEGLPELTEVKVSRRLPGTLKVEVRERQPVAWLACRALGIRERDRHLGLLVDSTGIPFRCASETLWKYAEKLPVILATDASEGDIVEGEVIKHRGLTYSLELVQIASAKLVGIEKPAWVMVKDEITLEMKTLGGIEATLSYYGLERQLSDFSKLVSHAQARGKELEKVNLIPERFIPVHYRANL